MSPRVKLGAYGLVLVAALGGGAAIGAVVGPIDTEDDQPAHADDHVEGPEGDDSPTADEGSGPEDHTDHGRAGSSGQDGP